MSLKTEEIYRTLLLNSADAVIVTDKAGLITTANPSFVRLIGGEEKDIVGQPLRSFIDLSSHEENGNNKPNGVQGHQGQDQQGQGQQELSAGAGLNAVSASGLGATSYGEGDDEHEPKPVTVLTRGGVEFVMPAAQFAIGQENTKAADCSHLTIVYVIQANSLQQAQTEFVSTVSHELRTPLTSIKGFADTILRAGDRLDVNQQRRYVGIIKDQADRLSRLVEDILAVSRLESKKLQFTIRAIDLKEAIERVVQNLSDKAKNHKLHTQVPAGLTPVWGDSDRLEQILTNLVDNAIKYSPAGTTVTISAKGIQDLPEMVEFAVSDQGVGIPEEHIPQVFSKFGRLDNPLVRQTEGTGLGLYITRSLVLALGGQITVTSQPGRTTFTVKLPASTLEQQAARGRD